MRKFLFLFIALFLFSIVSGIKFVPKQLIIKTSETRSINDNRIGLTDVDEFLDDNGIVSIRSIFNRESDRYFIVDLETEPNWSSIKNTSFDGINYIQPNYINTFYFIPNDPNYYEQNINYENIKLPEAWNYTTGNEEILIAIIDSGIHFDHPDLQDNIYTNENEIPDDGLDNDNNGYVDDWRGWDFVDAPELFDIALGDFTDQDNDPSDDINHGTHVSGTIGASTNNGIGVSGVCWNIKMLTVRAGFLTSSGSGFLQDDDAAAGIIYAADMGADIINISWGDENYSPIIADACEYALNRGSIVVASAGNTYGPGLMYPAKLSSTISVGSVDKLLNRANFSSYGPDLDIVAPGVNILSTYDNEDEYTYSEQSGTSMSAPFVSAALGLLFSVESGLTFSEVKARLHASATDIGEAGTDNEFGSGLLNVYSLLTNNAELDIEINYPINLSGHHESFDIIGTVSSDNLSRYNVMFCLGDDPTISEWFDVNYPHGNVPTSYTNEVHDDIIAHFDVEGLSEELNSYTVKVEAITNSNFHYFVTRTYYVDLTEPLYEENDSELETRYDAEYVQLYSKTNYNEPVYVDLDWSDIGTYSGNFCDSVQFTKLDNTWSEEPLIVTAINKCGLGTISELSSGEVEPDYSSINTNGYDLVYETDELIIANNYFDFDNNGKQEFWAFTITDDDQLSAIYELNSSNEIITKHIFNFSLWPHCLGNTDGEGLEMLGMNLDYAYIYKSDYSAIYPNEIIWVESNAYGGNFINYDNDEFDEIALVKNETIDSVTKRVIALYNRENNILVKENILINNTPTQDKNEFVNRVESAKLNNNEYNDILAADSDGDIMIFEYDYDTENYSMIWNYRLPVGNAYYLATGDFTGDGNIEFCAGGYNIDYTDPAKTFSHFEIFSFSEIDNDFISLDVLKFDQVQNKNSLTVSDLDGDDDQELILSLPPNAYIIDYVDEEFKPVWKGSSARSYNNIALSVSQSESEDSYFILSALENNTPNSAVFKEAEVFSGPDTPQNFRAAPLDENTVSLDWEYHSPVDYFNVYRDRSGFETLLDSTIDLYFTDHTLELGDSVNYRITAVSLDSDPAESLPTLWKQVTTSSIPELVEIDMVSLNTLRLYFTHPLSNNAVFINHYFVNNDINLPLSVNLASEHMEVILTFSNYFGEYDHYQISINSLEGISGVPVADNTHNFSFQEDTFAPEIVGSNVLQDKRNVEIIFNEAMDESKVEDLSNYTVVFPSIDQDNQLLYAEYQETSEKYFILLTMQENLKYTNQSYFLKIEDVEDLSGNKISNHGNKCRFSLTDINNLDYLIVYPNPLNMKEIAIGGVAEFSFINLPMGEVGKINIFDISGDLVFKDRFGPYFNTSDYYSWNARNRSGNRISSGMYFYILEVADDVKKGKLVIIN